MNAQSLLRDPEPVCCPIREISAQATIRGRVLPVRARLAGPHEGRPVVVLGGISAGRFLLADELRCGWWPGIAGEACALDPRSQKLLSVDFLGEDCAPFPSVEDQARAVLAAADAAGLDRFALAGASYGGMIALQIAAIAPERVDRLDVLCASARPHPMAQAWRAIQRDIVLLAERAGAGAEGVALARRLAMTTYRTPEELALRFRDGGGSARDAAGIESYLRHCGERYAQTTTPARFIALSLSLQHADVPVERIAAPCRLLGVTSDQLVPPDDVARTAARIPGARCVFIDSLYGHDAFLKEVEAVSAFLRGAL